MARHPERFPHEDDHGIGEIARRNAQADFRDQFGTGGRTQNMPEDYGTGRNPEPYDVPYDRGARDDPYARHVDSGPPLPGRGPGGGARRSEPPDWRGDAGWGRSWSGDERYQTLGYRGLGPKSYVRSDERILEDICERLWDADDVDARDVSVEVKNGEVTLRGNVEQRRIRHRIEDIADACGGVRDIRNEIRVQRRNEWPYDKGVEPGTRGNTGSRPGVEGGNEGMVQSAIEADPSDSVSRYVA
ncbi:MAG: BON domain-containing protein [Rhodanobacteraceae bacterium]